MSNRTMFANAISELGSSSNLSANECERFGMTWGCQPDCPVFERGDCKIGLENLGDKRFLGEIGDEETIEDFKKIYQKT